MTVSAYKDDKSDFNDLEFFIDPSRCIGCQACVQACGECDTHRGTPMIHLDYVDRPTGVQTTPVVCMHCEDPTCAKVCPADAIKQDDNGVVLSAAHPRCVSCSNCTLACPFGVPKQQIEMQLMMKCDMCYDRTSVGKKPMCATVCPSQALHFGSRSEIIDKRKEFPKNEFKFGEQVVRTKVNMMGSEESQNIPIDVADYLPESDKPAFSQKRVGAPDVANNSIWDNIDIKLND